MVPIKYWVFGMEEINGIMFLYLRLIYKLDFKNKKKCAVVLVDLSGAHVSIRVNGPLLKKKIYYI